jgi:hypothetical protein
MVGGGQIRTADLSHPKGALYHAELRPDAPLNIPQIAPHIARGYLEAVFGGVHRVTIDTHFEVEMGSCGVAGAADPRNHLSPAAPPVQPLTKIAEQWA